jgi:hypothetical protein
VELHQIDHQRVRAHVVRPDGAGGFTVAAPMLVGEKNSQLPWVAAADLTAPAGAATRPMRDLAVAYVDADAGGNLVARVKVLLGKDGGGFTPGQTHDLGPALTRSATVADLDDDGVADLVVSTYANEAATNNGTIRFFQGKTGAQAGFHASQTWFSIPETVGIRPQSVAIGRFGPKALGRGGVPRANMGLAAANAPGLRSVAVFLGNGRGAFVQPTVITTPLPKTAHLFLTGDFHSPGGADPLHDIAYLSDGEGGDKVLSILVSNGAGGFSTASDGPVASVGKGPHIAVSGNFDRSPPTDIAIVDASPDPITGAPFLKILAGKGNGQFTLFSQVSLEAGKSPIAMTAGHFSGQTEDAPADIAIITGDGSAEGKLTLLANDGEGRFPGSKRRFSRIPFKPVSIAALDNLRGIGMSDLVVRDADASIILLLQNLGSVDAGESQFKGGGLFGPTGSAPDLLVGEIAGNASAAQLDHIVTFSEREIRTFRANTTGTLDRVQVSSPATGNFSTRPPYAIADFGDGNPGLAVAARNQETLGVVHLKGDGRGGFTFGIGHEEPSIPRGEASEAQQETDFTRAPLSGETYQRTIVAALAAPFRSALHGNGKTDVAFVSSLLRIAIATGQCPNDPEPQPPGTPGRPAFTEQICHMEPPEFDACCLGPGGGSCSHSHCGPVRVCRPVEHPAIPAIPPPDPICVTTQNFARIITVFANTCDD